MSFVSSLFPCIPLGLSSGFGSVLIAFLFILFNIIVPMFSRFMRYFKMFNTVDLNNGSLNILSIYASNNVVTSSLYGASTNPLLTRLHISIVSQLTSLCPAHMLCPTPSCSVISILLNKLSKNICSIYRMGCRHSCLGLYGQRSCPNIVYHDLLRIFFE